jgi:hypothetical protein
MTNFPRRVSGHGCGRERRPGHPRPARPPEGDGDRARPARPRRPAARPHGGGQRRRSGGRAAGAGRRGGRDPSRRAPRPRARHPGGGVLRQHPGHVRGAGGGRSGGSAARRPGQQPVGPRARLGGKGVAPGVRACGRGDPAAGGGPVRAVHAGRRAHCGADEPPARDDDRGAALPPAGQAAGQAPARGAGVGRRPGRRRQGAVELPGRARRRAGRRDWPSPGRSRGTTW